MWFCSFLANISVTEISNSNIVVETSFDETQMLIKLTPKMQLYIIAGVSAMAKLKGLCGNFNYKEIDDFEGSGGLVEATASAFANTWKAHPGCLDKTDWLDDPCHINLEKYQYAEYWCSLLEKTNSPFSSCYGILNPSDYAKRCRYHTCNCKNSEVCMCAALSSYATACAIKGIILKDWRKGICDKYITACAPSQIYLYSLTTCPPKCQFLEEEEVCVPKSLPIDGCGCKDGEYLNENEECVHISLCSCYYSGMYLKPNEIIYKQNERCICHDGKLFCTAHLEESCPEGKTYMNCSITPNSVAAKHRACQTLNTEYFMKECISGCVCPEGLLDDGKGSCVPEEKCSCVHDKQFLPDGSLINVDCNTCVCKGGQWICSDHSCYGTCTSYSDGHYITFDGKMYDFQGKCEYVVAQDYCGHEPTNGTFSITTESVPCGSNGIACSKAIKIFIGSTELKLEEKEMKVIQGTPDDHLRYQAHVHGNYLVILIRNGIYLIWDKKTTIFIRASPEYKGKLCGLCGNFDDKSSNDFTINNILHVTNIIEFGNIWKVNPACPDVIDNIDPCTLTLHRRSWAEKKCSIIKSDVFKSCHRKVDPTPFFENCVNDACFCDVDGDCECFCSAVAVYSHECIKAEVCIYWRTPDICPIFCDYYNPNEVCEWHYYPCGNHTIQTCSSVDMVDVNITFSYLEGCYPSCPPTKPYFDDILGICVNECGCYVNSIHYEYNEKVPSEYPCQECYCKGNGNVNCLNSTDCSTPAPETSTGTSTTLPVRAVTDYCVCWMTDWINTQNVTAGPEGGDFEEYEKSSDGHNIYCGAYGTAVDITCRAVNYPNATVQELISEGQNLFCDVNSGLVCYNSNQTCYDYEIQLKCCDIDCPTTSSPETTPPAATMETTTPETITETTTPETITETTTPETTTESTTPETTTETTTPETTTETTTLETTTESTTPETTTETTTPETTTETTTLETTTETTTPETTTETTTPETATESTTPETTTETTTPETTTETTTLETTTETTTPETTTETTTPETTMETTTPENTTKTTTPENTTETTTPETTTETTTPETATESTTPETTTETTTPETTTETTTLETTTETTTPETTTETTTPETTMETTTPETTTETTTLENTMETTTPETTTETTTPETTTETTTLETTTETTTPETTTETTTPETTTETTTLETTTETTTPETTTETTTPETTTESTTPETTTESTTPETTTETTTPETTTETTTPETTTETTTLETTTETTTPETTTETTTPETTMETTTHENTTETTTPENTMETTTPETTTETTTPETTTETTTLENTMETTTPETTTETTTPETTTETTTLETTTETTTPETTTETTTPETTTESTTPETTTESTTPETTTETTTPETTTETTTPETTTETTTPETTTETTIPESATVTCIMLSPTTAPTTSFSTMCYCMYGGILYNPGMTITSSNTPEGCQVLFCSKECNIISENFNHQCPTTLPTSIITLTSHIPEISTTFPPSTPGMCTFDPPRQQYNETWMFSDCMMARCIENNIIEIIPKKCDPPSDIICANGFPQINVTDDDGCCWHWECPCVCLGFGDSHYFTFDGTHYDFRGECTYVLVEEITKETDNFGVYVDNYYCRNHGNCTRKIIIHYGTQEIEIMQKHLESSMLQVMVNEEAVRIPYKNLGVNISRSETGCLVEITDLDVEITLLDDAFILHLPYGYFRNNTQGLCGTCSNNKDDDGMLKNGSITQNFSTMAKSWIVLDPNNPECGSTETTTIYPPVTPSVCSPSPLCELIKGPQNNKYLTEGCFCPNGTMQFSPISNICVENCGCIGPDNLPRKFGEIFEFNCQDCICQEDGFGIYCEKKICPAVKTDPCSLEGFQPVTQINPNNPCCKETICMCKISLCPKSLLKCETAYEVVGEYVEGDCCPRYTCVCNTNLCPTIFLDCIIGYEVVHEYVSGRCCPHYKCVCNISLCPKPLLKCETGYEVVGEYIEGHCCPRYKCVCNISLCPKPLLNCETGYEVVGEYVEGYFCPRYKCAHKKVCVYRNAEYQGYNLRKDPGQCCGVCEQTHCILKNEDSVELLNPGDTRPLKNDNCTLYKCTKENNQLIHFVYKISCPLFFEEDCEPLKQVLIVIETRN
ncbi:mucin-2 [Xenopus laevis]|uniref:Mucin-2 n=1 Tax=Xenopus laevis TaxID=8355 RepID=A0A8J1MW46_XENLA|nr:mucin-2 [Xenopus laevis]